LLGDFPSKALKGFFGNNKILLVLDLSNQFSSKKNCFRVVDAIKITCDMTQTFRVRSMSMGIKRILLKLVDDIPETPYQPLSKRTGSISGFSTYQAMGLHLCWTTELSMGFDKST
jgi:hypothetical protein